MSVQTEMKVWDKFVHELLDGTSVWIASSTTRATLEQRWAANADFRVYVRNRNPELQSYMVQAFYSDARNTVLNRAGYYVQRAAKQSIRRVAKITTFSKPGEPPRTRSGKLKRTIYYAKDSTGTIVVGPIGGSSNVPNRLEYGGQSIASKSWMEKFHEVGKAGIVEVFPRNNRGKYATEWVNNGITMHHTSTFFTNHGLVKHERQMIGRAKNGDMIRRWVIRVKMLSGRQALRADELYNYELLSGAFVQGRGEYNLAARPFMQPALLKGKYDMATDSL